MKLILNEDDRVYGYVNGYACHSPEEFVYKCRKFGEITNDSDLIDWAEKCSHNWYNAGHHETFATFYIDSYDFSRNFTQSELNRLRELQIQAKEDLKVEQGKYDIYRYEGKPLTKEQIIMFLDKSIEDAGSGFWLEQAKESKSRKLSQWENGEVIEVYSCSYNDSYGNGTGSYSNVLMSDGTIKEYCYGYLD